VAKTQPVSTKIGLTRGKAALIGILAVALIGVIYVQFGSSAGEDATSSTYTPASRRPARRGTPPAAVQPLAVEAEPDGDTSTALLEIDQTKWQPPELSTVIAYDPFALPAAFPQPAHGIDPRLALGSTDATAAMDANELAEALERLETQLQELQQRGVQVIINKHDQYVAMIGDRLIHVGDEINGFTVTEIDPKGVRVERKDPQ
jgi:hypothetical protein